MINYCTVPGCTNKHYAKGLCNKHYLRKWFGKELTKRTMCDPNDFIIEGDICIISIYNRKSEKIAETIIDTEDYEKCRPYRWYGFKDRGNLRIRNGKVGFLSDFIMEFKPSTTLVVDHKNNNTLDNRRKSNLQICTSQHNIVKRGIQKNNTSGYKGVSQTMYGKWSASLYFRKEGKRGVYRLGTFSTKEEAAFAYNEKAKELFGEFAILNEVSI